MTTYNIEKQGKNKITNKNKHIAIYANEGSCLHCKINCWEHKTPCVILECGRLEKRVKENQ